MRNPSGHGRLRRAGGSCLLTAALILALAASSRPRAVDAGSEPIPGCEPLALVGGTLHLAGEDLATIEDGAVLIGADGKISAVGSREAIVLPDGIRVLDVVGLHLVPGFVELSGDVCVDALDARGLGRPEEGSVADSIDPFASAGSRAPGRPAREIWETLRRGGVTSVAVAGSRARGASGVGLVLKARVDTDPSSRFGGRLLAGESHAVLALGNTGDSSTTAARFESYRALRERLLGARDALEALREREIELEKYNAAVKKYNDALARKKGDEKVELPSKPKPPGGRVPSFSVAVLARALAAEIPVLIEARRRDEVSHARRLFAEFELRGAILGATRAPEDEKIAASTVPVVLSPVLTPDGALESRGHDERAAGRLAERGVVVAISTLATRVEAVRELRLEACAATRGGLDPDLALRAITLEPARILGVDARVGSIEVGKDADLVLLDGPPLDPRSRPVETLVEGRRSASTDAMDVDRSGRWTAERSTSRATIEEALRPLVDEVSRNAPTPSVRVLRGVRLVSFVGDRLQQLESATLVIQAGKITEVHDGRVADSELPEGARTHDLEGAWVLPGFLDGHSHVGLAGDLDDTSSAILPTLRVRDAFDPFDEELSELLRRGVTSVALSPGNANTIGGEVAVLKLLPGRVPLTVLRPVAAHKASLAPRLDLPRFPMAPLGATRALTEHLAARPDPRTLLVYFETRTMAQGLLRFSRALDPVPELIFLEGIGTDAQDLAALDAGAGFVLGPYGPGEPDEVLAAASRLAARGARLAFGTSGSRVDPLASALRAMAHGLSEKDALRALTASPAELLGVAGRVGRIESGLDADLVVFDGNPLALAGRVIAVLVDGELVVAGDEVVAPRAVWPPRPSSEALLAPSAVRHAPGLDRGSDRDPDIDASRDSGRRARGAPSVRASDDEATLWIVSDRVITGSSEDLTPGAVAVRAGRIVRVEASPEAGEGDRVIRHVGVLTAGLIDAGSTLGLHGSAADEFRETTPSLRVVDGLDLGSVARRRALLSGVTSSAVTPGSRNVIGGLGAVLGTHGDRLPAALLRADAFLSMSLTAETAAGNRTLRSGAPVDPRYRIPTTRMGTVYLARRALAEAAGEIPAGPIESGFTPLLFPGEREVLASVLRRELRLRVRAETEEEILTAFRIADEAGVEIQLESAREGLRLVGEIAARRVDVILDAGDVWSTDELDVRPGLGAAVPALLAEGGVRFAFGAGRSSGVASLAEHAGGAIRLGLAARSALGALTLDAARILGVDDEVGSIEVGKRADLVAWSGEPLASTSAIRFVLAAGQLIDPTKPEFDPTETNPSP